EVRYMSLRTFLTAAAGISASVRYCFTCVPMSPTSAARAGTTEPFSSLVRTYCVTTARGSEGADDEVLWSSERWVTSATAANCAPSPEGIERFSEYVMGTVPIRISMMSPMPFCPSFEPCANETPVQVSTRMLRIHQGGGVGP